jgi:hypothetical protein
MEIVMSNINKDLTKASKSLIDTVHDKTEFYGKITVFFSTPNLQQDGQKPFD